MCAWRLFEFFVTAGFNFSFKLLFYSKNHFKKIFTFSFCFPLFQSYSDHFACHNKTIKTEVLITSTPRVYLKRNLGPPLDDWLTKLCVQSQTDLSRKPQFSSTFGKLHQTITSNYFVLIPLLINNQKKLHDFFCFYGNWPFPYIWTYLTSLNGENVSRIFPLYTHLRKHTKNSRKWSHLSQPHHMVAAFSATFYKIHWGRIHWGQIRWKR